MLNIYKIKIPTPYPVGPVNSYLIKNRPYTLVDPGPDYPEAKEALLEGLAALGVAPADLARVVLTHSQSDHCGPARGSAIRRVCQVLHRLERRKPMPGYEYYGERLLFETVRPARGGPGGNLRGYRSPGDAGIKRLGGGGAGRGSARL